MEVALRKINISAGLEPTFPHSILNRNACSGTLYLRVITDLILKVVGLTYFLAIRRLEGSEKADELTREEASKKVNQPRPF